MNTIVHNIIYCSVVYKVYINMHSHNITVFNLLLWIPCMLYYKSTWQHVHMQNFCMRTCYHIE